MGLPVIPGDSVRLWKLCVGSETTSSALDGLDARSDDFAIVHRPLFGCRLPPSSYVSVQVSFFCVVDLSQAMYIKFSVTLPTTRQTYLRDEACSRQVEWIERTPLSTIWSFGGPSLDPISPKKTSV